MKLLLTVLLLFTVAGTDLARAETATDQLPDLGDGTGLSISPEQEYQLGRKFLRALRGQTPTVADALVQDYLERLTYRLAFHSPLKHPDLSLTLIPDPSINAFAVPGGVIGINVGLLLQAETEAEVSSVLAHELGHLSQRHFVRKLAENKQNMWMTLAGFLTTIALASAGDSQGAIAVNAATQAAMIDRSLAFSRQFEQEADRLGMQTLVDAGLDPHAMPTFFARMERASRVSGSIPEFVLTHPLTASRITDTYNRAKRYDVKLPQDSLDYQLARVRLMTVFMPTGSGGIARFQRQLAGQDERSEGAKVTRLGLALALLRDRQYDKAREAIAPLLTGPTPRSDFVIAAAEIELAERQYEAAIARLAPALAIAPESYPLQMYHARAQIAAGHPEAVLAKLESLARERPEDPQVWRLLVDGYTGSGNALGVYRARAEVYYLTGNDEKAVEQLQIAAETVKGNYPLYAKLQKRMREMAPEGEKGGRERD